MKDVHFTHIIPSLVNMKKLKFLSLEKNQLTDVSFSKYLKALVDHYGNGQNMALPENQGESQKQRSELFKICPLETLELTGCQLRDEGM